MLVTSTLLLITVTQVSAFFRLPCNAPLIVERADPIVSPGSIAGHVHTINGASNFGLNNTFESLRASTCSSCAVKEDMSVYWTPSLYMQFADGTFQSVQQTGGSLIYYLFRFNSLDTGPVMAFPSGLRMLVGSPTSRTYNASSLMSRAIGWNCLGATGTTRNPYLPPQNCPNGLRGEIMFPSCWNGVDLDSADHISHMAYPINNESGPCPAGFPVRIVTLFYETMWSIDPLNSLRSTAMNPTQPFVLASGDPTGYSYHGDFMDGWTPGILQQAVNTCTSASGVIEECTILHLYNQTIDGTCQKTPDVNEIVLGKLTTLPGCNLVSNTTASTLASCPNYVAPSIFKNPVVYTGAVPPPGSPVLANAPQVVVSYKNYNYIDCYSDKASTRALPTKLAITSKTVNACLDAAQAGNWKYVGIEYYGECWVGMTLLDSSLPVGFGLCGAPCTYNPLQICGGTTGTMDLYLLNTVVKSSSSSSSTPSPAPTPSGPSTVASYTGYNLVGCYSDKDSTRALPNQLSPTLKTVQGCLDLAKSSGYSLVGIEYGGECFGGHYLLASSTLLANSACSMTCTGNNQQLCGGPNAMEYYKFSGPLATEPITVQSYKSWTFVDCYTDKASVRALPNKLSISVQSVEACLDAATAAGYSMAGLEYYGECWAGNTLASTSTVSAGSVRDCQAVCKGNSLEYCGGTTGTFDYYKATVAATSQVRAVAQPAAKKGK